MENTICNTNKLASSNLVSSPFNQRILKGFPAAAWISRIVELALVADPSRNFYEDVANLYGIRYLPELPVPLNPKDALAYRVPTALLIDAQLFPFIQNNKMYVASSTPFIDKVALDNILSFTGRAGYELVITTPGQVSEALQHMYYIEFSAVAESDLKYKRKDVSASPPGILRFVKTILVLAAAILIGILIFPVNFLLVIFFLVNIFYIYLNGLRLATFIRSITRKDRVSVHVTAADLKALDDTALPRYTILVPLRFEAAIVSQLVKRIANLHYPKSKLQVLFLMGVDDDATIEALAQAGVNTNDTAGRISAYGYYMSIVKVPKMQVDTKPLVCNYGLRFATGDFTVVYDAEDKPEPDQLKKAVMGFQQTSLDTICLQGKLNFYNDRKNTLTRFFSLEYGMWYDYFLPGLQSIGSPVPLGGTSNHFVTNALRQTGEWDPYNVTEDADLGMRIYRIGRQTRILDAYTYEEATSTLKAWLKQRARWEKGFLVTLIVHLRHPIKLYRELGARKFIFGITVFFGNFYMPFVNPFLWILTILWVFNIFTLGDLPIYIWLPAVVNLVVGNLIHIAMHFTAAMHSKKYDLALLALFVPFYWIFISIATYIASWELLSKPYQWNKTAHGK